MTTLSRSDPSEAQKDIFSGNILYLQNLLERINAGLKEQYVKEEKNQDKDFISNAQKFSQRYQGLLKSFIQSDDGKANDERKKYNGEFAKLKGELLRKEYGQKFFEIAAEVSRADFRQKDHSSLGVNVEAIKRELAVLRIVENGADISAYNAAKNTRDYAYFTKLGAELDAILYTYDATGLRDRKDFTEIITPEVRGQMETMASVIEKVETSKKEFDEQSKQNNNSSKFTEAKNAYEQTMLHANFVLHQCRQNGLPTDQEINDLFQKSKTNMTVEERTFSELDSTEEDLSYYLRPADDQDISAEKLPEGFSRLDHPLDDNEQSLRPISIHEQGSQASSRRNSSLFNFDGSNADSDESQSSNSDYKATIYLNFADLQKDLTRESYQSNPIIIHKASQMTDVPHLAQSSGSAASSSNTSSDSHPVLTAADNQPETSHTPASTPQPTQQPTQAPASAQPPAAEQAQQTNQTQSATQAQTAAQNQPQPPNLHLLLQLLLWMLEEIMGQVGEEGVLLPLTHHHLSGEGVLQRKGNMAFLKCLKLLVRLAF